VLNGEPLSEPLLPSTYLTIPARDWKDGDTLVVHFPLSLRFEALADARPSFHGVGVVMYGPIMLAGLTAENSLLLADGATDLSDRVKRVSATALSFEATRTNPCAGSSPGTFTMLPFADITNALANAAYTVYFHTRPKPIGATTPAGTPQYAFLTTVDFDLVGGASVVPNDPSGTAATTRHKHHATHAALENSRHDRRPLWRRGYDPESGNHFGAPPSVMNLRSGERGQHTAAVMSRPFEGKQRLKSIAFAYRYVVGFGKEGGAVGAQMSLTLETDLECLGQNSTVLYTSPRLMAPSYDKCHTCYSEPVNVSVSNLDIDVSSAAAIALRFDNGDHNLQILLPLEFSFSWM